MGSLVQLAVESLNPGVDVQGSTSSTDGGEAIDRGEVSTDIATLPESVSSHSSPPHFQLPRDSSENHTDWESETCLPVVDADLDRQLRSVPGWTPAPSAQPRILVFIGVTRLLGSHLLEIVLGSIPTVTKVIRIGVRNLPPSHTEARGSYSTQEISVFPVLGCHPLTHCLYSRLSMQ